MVTVYVSRYVRPGTVMGAGQNVVGKTPPGTLTSWHDEAAQICMSEAGLKGRVVTSKAGSVQRERGGPFAHYACRLPR